MPPTMDTVPLQASLFQGKYLFGKFIQEIMGVRAVQIITGPIEDGSRS